MRSNSLTRLALTMLLVGSSAASTAAEPAIYNVMVAHQLACSDNPASIATRIHPERATIQTSGKLHVGNTGYWVDFNAIPGYRGWTAVTRFQASDRGVDDNYVLLSRTGMPPFDAAYVVTHLPVGLRGSPDNVLLNVMDMQRANANGGKTSFIRTSTPMGEGLEMISGGRVGSHCFPTSHFKYAASADQAAVGISRFVVHGDYLIEYSLSVPASATASQPEMIALGQRAMDTFVQGLKPPTD